MNKILSILLCFFCLAGLSATAQKKKYNQKKAPRYWRPSRIPTSTSATTNSVSPNDFQALHRIIQAENQRLNSDPYLLQAVFSPSDQVSKAAILALGRIGDPYCIETLSRVLNGKNIEKRRLAAFSLGMLSTELSAKLLTQHLTMETNPGLRADFLKALGYSRNITALNTLQKALVTEKSSTVQSAAIQGLGILFSGESANWPITEDTLKLLAQISQSSGEISSQAAFALSQFKGDARLLPLPEILSATTQSKALWARAFLSRTLGKIDSSQTTTLLLSLMMESNPPPVRIEAIKALKGRKISELSANLFDRAINSTNHPLTVATLDTIQSNPESFPWLTNSVDKLFNSSRSTWVKNKALSTLCRLNKEKSSSYIHAILTASKSPQLASALACLTFEETPESLHQLVPYLKNGDPLIVSESIEQMAQLNPNKITEEIKNSLKELVYKKDPGLVALISDLAKQMAWKDFAKPLSDVYVFYNTDETTETKVALVSSLGELGTDATIPLFTSALKDNSRQVVTAATQALRKITGNEPNILLPLNNRVLEITPPIEQLKEAALKTVTLKTNRGDIEFKLLDEAPLTSYRFIELIRKNFYAGKKFHRVVPNFVTQGGDPRGDGFGGPGFLIRDEVSLYPHERGTLGIATSGKDTGGCQFFFNLSPNYHLNGKYTVFAKVISGLEVMDKLEVGDEIISVRIN